MSGPENRLFERVASKPRVVHLTSVHPAFDDRIFYRECLTLARSGYDVVIIAPGDMDDVIDGVRLKVVRATHRRFGRMIRTTWYVFLAALRERPAIFHFHDPELIPVGLILRTLGSRVIYDVHEDVPEDVLTKQWIPSVLRPVVANTMSVLHRFAARRFSAVISATETIAQGFNPNIGAVVHNYPLQEDGITSETGSRFHDRPHRVVYAGTISRIRGIDTMITAMSLVKSPPDARLVLCGRFENDELEKQVRENEGWHKVSFLGWRKRAEVQALLSGVRAGLVLFHPGPNHDESLPAKLFEYMAAGLPVIGSDFPLWRSIITASDCGFLVDPNDPMAVAKAISYTLTHPDEAEAMGHRGRAAVAAHFNWNHEAGTLLNLYARLDPTHESL